jgi:PIN domain nuclease of toxin-antitoxin system
LILLDTHIFLFWLNKSELLRSDTAQTINAEANSILVSAISLWEIAKLVEGGRLELTIPVRDWIEQALAYPLVQLVPLSPAIAVESTELPQPFHKDPADQIIVATARELGCTLLTYDAKILAYPHVSSKQSL